MTTDRTIGLTTGCTASTVSPSELGRWMEGNGFDSLWFGEHSHIPVNLQSKRRNYQNIPQGMKQMYDPLLALMAVANTTTNLKLGTSIALLTGHHAISFAKRVATLDHISGGRLILGVGAGWSAEEMADHGVSFENRWKYVRECVLAAREIWGNEIAEYRGEMISFPPMWCGPKPVRGAMLPVLIGASGKYAFPRMVEYGEGWIPIDQGEAMGTIVDDLRHYLSEHGKAFKDFDHTVITHPLSATDVDSAKHFGGNAEALKQRIDELHGMGFNRVLLQLSFDERDAQWKELERLQSVMKAFA